MTTTVSRRGLLELAAASIGIYALDPASARAQFTGTLSSSYTKLKSGLLWRQYAKANPTEATKIDGYVKALASGYTPKPPLLATATGSGLVGMMDNLANRTAAVAGAELPPGYYNVHTKYGLPTDGSPCSSLVASMIANAPRGAALLFGNCPYTFTADASTRPDLAWVGVPVGSSGNNSASERVGTWWHPDRLGVPVLKCAPTTLAQAGPTFQNLHGYIGNYTTDFLFIRNINRGRIEAVDAMYGRAAIDCAGGDDDAYWDVTNIGSFHCTYGLMMANNFGWHVRGANWFMDKDQTGWFLTSAAQNNFVSQVHTDGVWDDATRYVAGTSVYADGQAHHNFVNQFKFESTNPAVVLRSPDASVVSPTRAISFREGVVGGRYGTTIGFDIGRSVDQTYIGDDVFFVSGSTSPIRNLGTNTHPPARLLLS